MMEVSAPFSELSSASLKFSLVDSLLQRASWPATVAENPA